MARHLNPRTGVTFNGFRTICKPYVVVFTIVGGNVLVTCEWKHGNDKITIVPVAGVPGKAEAGLPTLFEKMRATAFREWKEETGTTLKSAELLGPSCGLFSEVRKMDARCFPFLGEVVEPIVKGPTRLDSQEHLIMVAFPLQEWVKLVETPRLWDANPDFGLEECTRGVTYAALRRLGLLKLNV